MATDNVARKWPGPVTVNDDDPKKGFSTIFLTIPELQVSKPLLGMGKATPENAAVTPDFKSGSVAIVIAVKNADTKTIVYEYKKQLPEDIDPVKSSVKVKKGQVIVTLCKADGQSWAEHARYLIKKE